MTITWTKLQKTGTSGDYWYVNNICITSETPNTFPAEEYSMPLAWTDTQIEEYVITDLIAKGY